VGKGSDARGAGGFDTSIANVARVYDYLLGGKDNFAADRELGEQLLKEFPTSAWIARQNRAFLGRAVRYCAEQGATQFLDVGSGLPTMENVHEVARRTRPDARVVYVDSDPIALTHANALLATSDGVAAIAGDIREPDKIIAKAAEHGIDFHTPVVILLLAVLHFITDAENPGEIVRVFRDAMPPGSYLIISTATHDYAPEESERARGMYRKASAPMVTRSRAEVEAFFEGLELVEPGLVFTTQWRPVEPVRDPGLAGLYAGVGYRP
jgi:O-methyltransferase involved in polyketide biosynthesis